MSALRWLPGALALAGLGAVALAVLVTAGQPIITDDAWLHLALGRAYVAEGPWLAADPLLATSLGPPTPAAWLFDAALYGLLRGTGFTGLRAVHVVLVAGILGVAWTSLLRAGRSPAVASLASALFLTLAAYRLIQLRPHLLTILATLGVYWLLIERDARPTRGRVALVVALFALWANVHAAFVLGPALVGTALCALVLAMPIRGRQAWSRERSRIRVLAVAGALGALATLLNPAGLRPHLAWFVAGDETPSLGRVADEWAPFDPFSWPPSGLPPSALGWAIQWGLMVATAVCIVAALRAWRRERAEPSDTNSVDPALVGLALLGLALPLVAVRFLWLGVLPLLLIAHSSRIALARRPEWRARARIAIGVASVLVAVAFFRVGPWDGFLGTLPTTPKAYAQPYPAGKYHARLVWITHDAGLRGTAFTDYHLAGFAGFYLAPAVRTLVNGTLNVPPEVMDANWPLRARRGARPGERFVDLLDRHAVDLYFGTRLPYDPATARPHFHTTVHLERTPGWIPVFRNLTGALYLRDDADTRENLERIAALYAEQDVPFDPEVGFDVERVIRERRSWSIAQGLIPVDFDRIARSAFGSDPATRDPARNLLASVYAALGLYERAIALDRAQIGSGSAAESFVVRARRRLVWSLLRIGDHAEAAAQAEALRSRPENDRLSRRIARAASDAQSMEDAELRASLIAQLPVFDAYDVANLVAGIVLPPSRPAPD